MYHNQHQQIHPSLTFDQPSITDTTLSYLNDPHRPVYKVETHKNGTMSLHKITTVYREPGMHLVGQIELHSLNSDVVTGHLRQDIRPSSASSLGFSSSVFSSHEVYFLHTLITEIIRSKDFKAGDGQTYTWKWKAGLGWLVRPSFFLQFVDQN